MHEASFFHDMTFYKKPPFSMTGCQIEKHMNKKIRANGETLNKQYNHKFHEILTKPEGDISKN